MRLPLQVGTACVYSLARGAVACVPIGGTLAAVIRRAYLASQGQPIAIDYFDLALLLLLGVPLARYAWIHLRLAWRKRPSDLHISAEGLRFDGGPLDGQLIPFREIDAQGAVVTEETEKRPGFWRTLAMFLVPPSKDVRVWRLWLKRKNGARASIAEAEQPAEVESLRALADTIRAAVARVSEAARPRAPIGPPDMVRCPACAAPVSPSDAPSVACGFCAAAVPIPEPLRQKVRAARTLHASRPRVNALITRLLRQPGAHRINRVLVPVAVLMLIAWPLSVLMTVIFEELGSFSYEQRDALFFAPPFFIAGLFFFARTQLINRFALHLLTFGFAARAPIMPGAPHTCRHCGGPLPPPAEAAVVVRCAYCGFDSVMGIDLETDAGLSSKQAQTLEQALKARARAWLRWGALLVASIALLNLAVKEASRLTKPAVFVDSGRPGGACSRLTFYPRFAVGWPMMGKNPYHIFYLRWAGADEMGRPTGAPELFTAPLSPFDEDKAKRLLPGVSLGEPVVLPDGDALLSVEQIQTGGMHLVRRALLAEGGASITSIHTGAALERPTIDIDGAWVSFAEEVEGRWFVTVMRLDGSGPPRRIVEGRRPALRPDAQSIAFIRLVGGRPRLFTVRLDEKDPEAAVERVVRGEEADQDHPFWSPDNRWLAYLTNDEWAKHRGGSPERTWNIQAVGADGDEPTIYWVTVGNAHVREAFWGPGNKIFFRANTSTEEALHYVGVEGKLAAQFWYRPNKR